MPDSVPGFSKSSLSRIETFKQPYSEPILLALAEALGCEPADLLRAPDNAAWQLVQTLDDLDEDALAQVARIAETFRKSA